MMTAQQVFDRSAEHLLKQQQRSTMEGGKGCVYRNANGLQCAAGPFVVDEIKDTHDNNASFSAVPARYLILELQDCRDEHYDLIRDLQRVHDTINVCFWSYELQTVAMKHGLSSEVLERHRHIA